MLAVLVLSCQRRSAPPLLRSKHPLPPCPLLMIISCTIAYIPAQQASLGPLNPSGLDDEHKAFDAQTEVDAARRQELLHPRAFHAHSYILLMASRQTLSEAGCVCIPIAQLG